MTIDPIGPLARSLRMRTLPVLLLLGCHRSVPTTDAGTDTGRGALLLRGGIALGVSDPGLEDGQSADILIVDGKIAALGPSGTLATEGETVDLGGRWVTPAFIDSHVHLAYRRDLEGMADGGVAGAVDMAAPLEFLSSDTSPLVVRASGPMITAVGGYPTQGWGENGYGLECADAAAAAEGVRSLAAKGVHFIKLPVTDEPVLDDEALASATEAAHGLGLLVASHALSDETAARAATAGSDVLAHTPTGRLSDETVAAWSGRTVVSTLGAFGGSDTTVANLVALRAAGAKVLYGTDFGNTRTAGVDPEEIALLVEAGLSGAEILASGTSEPASLWGFEDLGVLRVGARASLLVLSSDPREQPGALAAPEAVYLDGAKR